MALRMCIQVITKLFMTLQFKSVAQNCLEPFENHMGPLSFYMRTHCRARFYPRIVLKNLQFFFQYAKYGIMCRKLLLFAKKQSFTAACRIVTPGLVAVGRYWRCFGKGDQTVTTRMGVAHYENKLSCFVINSECVFN